MNPRRRRLRRRLLAFLFLLTLAWAAAVAVLATPHVSWSRLPVRASVLPSYSTVYLVPAQVAGIDILFGPIPLPAPKSDDDWDRLEADTGGAVFMRNAAAAGAISGIALLPTLLLGLGLGLRRFLRGR